MEPRREGAEGAERSHVPLAGGTLAACAVGGWLVARGTAGALSAGILLLIVALATAGVLLGGRPHGPDVEGPLDLSARLGLGLLGGALGAAVAGSLLWLLAAAGLPRWLAVAIHPVDVSAGFGRALSAGALWGLVFGVLLPVVPARRLVARGALFGWVPALYALLKVLPVDRDLGPFGVELGGLTFLFVILYHTVWGAVAGQVVGWGFSSRLAPVSRPLGEAE